MTDFKHKPSIALLNSNLSVSLIKIQLYAKLDLPEAN